MRLNSKSTRWIFRPLGIDPRLPSGKLRDSGFGTMQLAEVQAIR